MNEIAILQELVLIRWILVVLLGLLVCISAAFVWSLFEVKRLQRSMGAGDERELFMSEAQALEDRGSFETLQQLAESRLQRFPHDASAYWFLGIAHYRQRAWGRALEAFSYIQTMDPAWNRDAVLDYVEEIRANMSGPRRGT